MKLFKKTFTGILLPLLFLVFTQTVFGQDKNRPITDNEKLQVIDKSITLLKENYVFPSKVEKMEKVIRKKFADGSYAGFSTLQPFLDALNKDLETLSNDRHVNVFFDPLRVKQIEAESKSSYTAPSFSPEFVKRAEYENYMVRKAERLDGNVGYLKLDMFVDIRLSKPTLVGAMNFLSNVSALVIDLRQNGGGNANTVLFLENYFLPDSTHISNYTSRLSKTTKDVYTVHDDLIRKFSNDVPLYILVSKRTSSAAEAFAYDLQAFKRAVVIGDTTNGEANPGYALVVNSDMYLMVPTSINANIITKTNWQGVGVIPNVLVKADKAFIAAQASAYKELSKKATQPAVKNRYEWLATAFDGRLNAVKLDEKDLQKFVGSYADNRKISFEQQSLFYQRGEKGEKNRLLPLTKDLFEMEGVPYFRVRFVTNERSEVTALEGMYDDGKSDLSLKTSLASK